MKPFQQLLKNKLPYLAQTLFFILICQSYFIYGQKIKEDDFKITNPCDASFSYSKQSNMCPPKILCFVPNNVVVTFKAHNTSAKTYSWDFGDGNSDTGAVVSHGYFKPGDYKIILTVSNEISLKPKETFIDGKGYPYDPAFCKESHTEVITIDFNKTDTTQPLCKANFNFYEGDTKEFKFEDISQPAYHESYWQFGDGEEAVGNIVKHKYKKAGFYNVTLIITSENKGGACKDLLVQQIEVKKKEKEECKAEFNSYFSDGGHVKFQDISKGKKHRSYWSFGDGSESKEGEVVTHIYKEEGKYLASLTIVTFDKEGNSVCKDYSEQIVYIKERATIKDSTLSNYCSAKFVAPVQNFTIMPYDDFATYKTFAATHNEYFWNFGDGSSTISETFPSHTYKNAGKYTITATKVHFDASEVHTMEACDNYYEFDGVKINIPCHYFESCRKSYKIDVSIGQDDIGNKDDYGSYSECNLVFAVETNNQTLNINKYPINYFFCPVGLSTVLSHIDFGDGSDTTTKYWGISASHTYSKPGLYLVKINYSSYEAYEWSEKPELVCQGFYFDKLLQQDVPCYYKQLCQGYAELWIQISDSLKILTNIQPNLLDQKGTLVIKNAINDIELQIFNNSGKMIKKIERLGNGLNDFETQELENGLYFYKTLSNGKVIKQDKFMITH